MRTGRSTHARTLVCGRGFTNFAKDTRSNPYVFFARFSFVRARWLIRYTHALICVCAVLILYCVHIRANMPSVRAIEAEDDDGKVDSAPSTHSMCSIMYACLLAYGFE